MYADKTLTCVECGASFIFSAEDQEFHAQKGFANEPKRCPSCRAARRADRGGSTGGGSYYQSGPREMYSATCAQCGQEALVPFQPRGDRPVYCNDCFQSQRQSGGYGGRSGGRGGNYSRNSGGGGGRW